MHEAYNHSDSFTAFLVKDTCGCPCRNCIKQRWGRQQIPRKCLKTNLGRMPRPLQLKRYAARLPCNYRKRVNYKVAMVNFKRDPEGSVPGILMAIFQTACRLNDSNGHWSDSISRFKVYITFAYKALCAGGSAWSPGFRES